ncbi:class I SAM-dependent methyltransferase [Streptomyces sp. BPTC-684]|uniref:class I SAM-dependent DNA methyltransferase n=1 Tax=Streptomyces sp. BPTC-684 TaxID=3043734 RepID=UPI0024B16EAA|nr:class I SAM-dependent methyltransferase [Streptomyces sp. BPTC-684]WHM40935.1 methyltransferase domain-containing protein [Streptomyces sp. BPTC-684]
MASRFDALGDMYEEMFRLPWRAHLESFSVLRALGALEGEQIYDIGCGTGLYSRVMKRRGAARVVGYDISEGMIAVARRREADRPLGIEYTTTASDAEAGAFGRALGVYILPYAEDYTTLVEMCSIAARALRPGGLFVTLPVNPDYHGGRAYYERYGLRLFDAEPRADASRVTLELCFGRYAEQITARYWTRGTLERALRESGFEAIDWPAFRVSEEGIARYGEEFWHPYLDCPHASMITCAKV